MFIISDKERNFYEIPEIVNTTEAFDSYLTNYGGSSYKRTSSTIEVPLDYYRVSTHTTTFASSTNCYLYCRTSNNLLHQLLALFMRKNIFMKMSCSENGWKKFSAWQWCKNQVDSFSSCRIKIHLKLGRLWNKFFFNEQRRLEIQANPVQV